MNSKEIGDIEVGQQHAELQFKWKITDFFTITGNENVSDCESPIIDFANAKWYFELSLRRFSSDNGFMKLFLIVFDDYGRDFAVEYNFGLQKLDGNIEWPIKRILTYEKDKSDCYLFALSQILQKKAELAPSSIVTIMCTLKIVTTYHLEPERSYESKCKKLRTLDTLSENFKNLLKNKASCDITLYVKDKEYKAHKAVLIARSSVFAAMLQHEMSEKQMGIINIPDCDPNSFGEFLEFLYCGKVEDFSSCKVFSLYEISDKYNVEDIKDFCSEYLKDNLTAQNICDTAIFADKYDDIYLKSAVQDFFNENVNDIFETSEWEHFLENEVSIAKRLLKAMAKVKFTKR